MIPRQLEGWTVPVIEGLLQRGYDEQDAFEFREKLPHPRDPAGNERLRKTAAGFANTSGGFLIFGVAHHSPKPVQERLVGVETSLDFAQQFGQCLRPCRPSLDWQMRQPPLVLPSGRPIPVVHIPRSRRGPHGVDIGDGWLVFPKRTPAGSEPMPHSELRRAFVLDHQMRAKLVLLFGELDFFSIVLAGARQDPARSISGRLFPAAWDSSPLRSLLAELSEVLADVPEFGREAGVLRASMESLRQAADGAFHRWLGSGAKADEARFQAAAAEEFGAAGGLDAALESVDKLKQHAQRLLEA